MMTYRRALSARCIEPIHRKGRKPDHSPPEWPSGRYVGTGAPVSRRAGVLELAVLGLLADTPMHGYELRKRLGAVLGSFRAFSYGSLYPCLKELVAAGWIATDGEAPKAGRRSKIVYKLTADGKEHLQTLLAEAGPSAWEDDNFGVHFAFFGRT